MPLSEKIAAYFITVFTHFNERAMSIFDKFDTTQNDQ